MGKILNFIGEVIEAVAEKETQNKKNMIRCLEGCTFDSARLEMAKGMVNSRTILTCEEVRDMMKTFSFDGGKIELAKYAWKKVVDPYNFYLVSEAMTFYTSQREVMRYANANPRY